MLEIGRLAQPPEILAGGGRRMVIAHSKELGGRLAPGASLAVSGVCLTVADLEMERCVVELAPETLRRTRLGELEEGARINLEPALRPSDSVGGHWVTGHVDGLVRVVERVDQGPFAELRVELPEAFRHLVALKGSVALDGVSLTVAWTELGAFGVALIPETLSRTTLGEVQPGDRLHFEADLLARYVARVLEFRIDRS